MIEVIDLCKSYGPMLAVDEVGFTVRPGAVTAFVGPNGAGKSTVLRIALGLDTADSGSVLIQGRPYRLLDAPSRRVGALLDAGAIHPGQTGRTHLRILARAAALPPERVEQVLAQVGLEAVARDRVRTYSLGMRQRLGIAAALLGDPDVLILDEPTNGMDPEGIGWLENLLRSYAAAGRTVLMSSHHMSELEQVADRVVVIAAGRVVADADLGELVHGPGAPTMRVQTPDTAALRSAVAAAGGRCAAEDTETEEYAESDDADEWWDGAVDADDVAGFVDVHGLDRMELAELFLHARIRVLGLAPVRASLQDVYAELTADLGRHQSSGGELPEPSGSEDDRYAAGMIGRQSSRSSEEVAGR
ncbi:ATP-binding cassette domain-containing protein [Actinospica durhamensis]|uniref:ATP-binding cassette domain-containing protein n=1 Tax=Actinospica durhamensis TaxID=1508375 RepID=A0A941EV30_9ACTN|nr:ATP-binding cassette domain-containing protein [Actinospica durhamensis]MBR7834454.1 ATP-binding cassette domain-containing protein [Actinospica durhamensis]